MANVLTSRKSNLDSQVELQSDHPSDKTSFSAARMLDDAIAAHDTCSTADASSPVDDRGPTLPALETNLQSPGLRDVTIYSSEPALRQPIAFVRSMFRDAWQGRELAWRLFLRDLQAQYRQSMLGYLWVVLPPLATTAIWVFLSNHGIVNLSSGDIPYPVFVLTGMVLWETFVAALNAPLTTVISFAPLLAKINFPREALLLSAFAHVLFNMLVRMAVLVAVFMFYGASPGPWAFAAPVGLIAVMLLGSTLGVLLVPLGVLYQDVGRALGSLTAIWFFLTPVVYTAPTTGPGTLLVALNPISPLLITTREMLTSSELTQLPLFFLVTAIALAVLFVAWAGFRLAMPHLIARMSA